MSFSFVQGAGADGGSATNVAKAFTGNVTAGNRVVVIGWAYQDAAPPGPHTWVATDCTKSAGTATLGTITIDAAPALFTYSVGNNISVAIWSAPVTSSGSCTMKIAGLSTSGGSLVAVAVGEFNSSLGLISVSGITNSHTATTASTDVNSGNVTTALGVGSMLIGVGTDPDDPNNTNQGYTPNNSFTNIFSTLDGLISATGAAAYRFVTAQTTISADWTLTGASRNLAAVAGYQEPSGSTSHATTGALTGPGSTVAGTAAHKTKHTTSGALTGPGSTVHGTAAHPHRTSGALIGAGSTVAGTSTHKTKHVTSGALTGQGSTVAGVAKRFRAHGTSGALAGVSSTLAGTAVHTAPGVHAASGALIGAGALILGSARLTRLATGQNSGGYFEPQGKRRTKEDIRADRIRFGVLQEPKAVEAVREVAKTVIEARNTKLALQEQEQADLLRGTLLKQGIELKATPRIEAVLRTILLEEMARQEKEDWSIVELMFNEL